MIKFKTRRYHTEFGKERGHRQLVLRVLGFSIPLWRLPKEGRNAIGLDCPDCPPGGTHLCLNCAGLAASQP